MLTSLTEPHGETVTLSYSSSKLASVSTSLAGTISLTRDSAGRVIGVTRQRDSLSFSYTYDSSGNLASSADFDGNTTLYTYTLTTPTVSGTTPLTVLSSIEDPLHRKTLFTYYGDGRAFTQTEPGNAHRKFIYAGQTGAPNPSTQVTDVDGTTSVYSFDSNGRVTQTLFPNGATTAQTWTNQNQVSAATDELGLITQLNHDNRGNLTGIQRPEDLAPVQIAYESTFDHPTQVTPLAGSPLSFTVDPSNGNTTVISRADSLGALSLAVGFDNFGNPVSINNGLAQYSNATDSNGLMTFVFDSHNPETRTYDNRGRVTARAFATGRRLTYVYDNFDRILRINDSNGPSLIMTYDIMGRMQSRTVASANTSQTTSFGFDDRDRLTSVTDPLGRVTQYQYDVVASRCQVVDKPARVIDPAGRTTSLSYDSMQRLVQRTAPDGSVTTFGYNPRGDTVFLTDAKGQKTVFFYDGNKRLTRRERPSVLTGSNGLTTATTDVTIFKYDASGKMIREEHPSASAAGATQVIELTYNSLDRVTRKVLKRELNGAVTNVQDDSNFSYQRQLDTQKLSTANNSIEQLSFTYENVPPFTNTSYNVKAAQTGNPLNIQEGTFNVARAQSGQIGSVALGDSMLLAAEYDPAGRMTEISSHFTARVLSAEMRYDGLGRRSAITYSNGLSGSFAYDNLNRTTAIGFQGAGQAPFNEALAYDLAGNISSVVRELGIFRYSYDQKDQLTTSSFAKNSDRDDHGDGDDHDNLGDRNGDVLNRNFGYDPVGNRLTDTVNGQATFINNFLVQNKTNAFTADSDGLGNTASKLDRKTGQYDSFQYRIDKKLTSFTRQHDEDGDGDHDSRDPVSQSASYYFDALGRRVAKVIHLGQNYSHNGDSGHGDDGDHGDRDDSRDFTQTFTYLSDQDKILLAKNGRGELTLYLDGRGIDEHLGQLGPSGVKAYITDHLGTVINAEAVGAKRAVAAFGESLATTSNADGGDNQANGTSISNTSDPAQYGFAGRQFDLESGLYYMRARMYDPSTGRFMSMDPIGLVGGVNPYAYVQNNPVRYSDPSGMICIGTIFSALWRSLEEDLANPFRLYVDLNPASGGRRWMVVPVDPSNPTGSVTLIELTGPPLPPDWNTMGPPLPPNWTPTGPELYGPPEPPGNGPPPGSEEPIVNIAKRNPQRSFQVKKLFMLAVIKIIATVATDAFAQDLPAHVGNGTPRVITGGGGAITVALPEAAFPPKLRTAYAQAKRIKILTSEIAVRMVSGGLHPGDATNVVRMLPIVRDKNFLELLFKSVQNSENFGAVGLRSGDTLLAVNGKRMPLDALKGPDTITAILGEPQHGFLAGHVELFVKRNGKYIRLAVDIRKDDPTPKQHKKALERKSSGENIQ